MSYVMYAIDLIIRASNASPCLKVDDAMDKFGDKHLLASFGHLPLPLVMTLTSHKEPPKTTTPTHALDDVNWFDNDENNQL